MNFLVYQLEAAACLALFYIVFVLFLKWGTFFRANRYALLLALVASLLIPLIDLPAPANYPVTITENINSLPQINEIVVYARTDVQNSIPINDIIILLYIIISLFFAGKLLVSVYKVLKLAKESDSAIINGTKIKIIPKDANPFTFLKYIFINNKLIEDADLSSILRHEKVHSQQLHSIDILIVEAIKAMQWFNPVVYLFGREIRENHEFLADTEAITKKDYDTNYINAMLNQAIGAQMSDLANNFNSIKLIKRLKMITKPKSAKSAAAKYILLLPAILVLLLVFSCKEKVGEQISTNSVWSADRYTDKYPLVLKSGPEKQEGFNEKNTRAVQYVDNYAERVGKPADFYNQFMAECIIQQKWLAAKKAGKVSIAFKVDKYGNASDPIITNFKMADDADWGIQKLSKEDEEEIFRAFRKVNLKCVPAMKDSKPIDSYMAYIFLFGDQKIWNEFNLGGEIYRGAEDSTLVGLAVPSSDPENHKKLGKTNISSEQLDFILSNLKYPEKAKQAGKEGTVKVFFKVDGHGNVSDAKVDEGIGYGCDEEALRVVKQLKGFPPNSTFGGKKDLILPIKFMMRFRY